MHSQRIFKIQTFTKEWLQQKFKSIVQNIPLFKYSSGIKMRFLIKFSLKSFVRRQITLNYFAFVQFHLKFQMHILLTINLLFKELICSLDHSNCIYTKLNSTNWIIFLLKWKILHSRNKNNVLIWISFVKLISFIYMHKPNFHDFDYLSV